jgi:hypothetical protein
MTMEEATFDIETHAAAQESPASWETLELRRAIARAQKGLDELALPQPVLEDVNRSLEAAAKEAAQPRPDRYGVAEHLAAATIRLEEAGGLADAGTEVVRGLRRAVALLGPIGVALGGL